MSEVDERIRRVLNQALALNVGADELAQAERADDLLGLDSIALLEFVMALEKEFGITFNPEKLDPEVFADLDRLSRHVESRLAESA